MGSGAVHKIATAFGFLEHVCFFFHILYRPVLADMDNSCTQLWRLILCCARYWSRSEHAVTQFVGSRMCIVWDIMFCCRDRGVQPCITISASLILGTQASARQQCTVVRLQHRDDGTSTVTAFSDVPDTGVHHRCIWCASRC